VPQLDHGSEKACFATPDQQPVAVLSTLSAVITLGNFAQARYGDRPKLIGGSGVT
jgi:hypothetical protein